ncbi:MAG: hydrogenase iron-sulfur subunit [Deltaproteobacteria bacterium]|nr:hydrogenase iron-sulfur subunit [Deltaproteobacteria bacterium]MBW1792873.1 hydrogenase iron-sulfur subunit [Deltaproteobacteria bacterium]
MTEDFYPRILVFCCNWCSYAGADLAGVSRIQYPATGRIIRGMCSGRVDPTLIADAFIYGADGFLILGCHFGDCHYIDGNYKAQEKIDMAHEALVYAGLNPDRLEFNQASAAEGQRFADLNTEFHERIQKLGPLGSADKYPLPELTERLKIAQKALAGPKLRWVVGKKSVFTNGGNKYGEVFTQHEINRTLSGIIIDEMATHSIIAALEKKPAAVKDLAKELEIPPPDTLKYVLALNRRGFVEMDGVEGTSPMYKYKGEQS